MSKGIHDGMDESNADKAKRYDWFRENERAGIFQFRRRLPSKRSKMATMKETKVDREAKGKQRMFSVRV